jgi:hypothetical protein
MASVRMRAPGLIAGSGPDCVTTNQDWDTTYIGTSPDQLPGAIKMEKKSPIYHERKKEMATPKNSSKPKKKDPDCFCFCFCFCFCSTPFFSMIKGIKLKEKQRESKKEYGSRPLLAGYGLGTRSRATLARILIPGPDSDPYLRIRVRELP